MFRWRRSSFGIGLLAVALWGCGGDEEQPTSTTSPAPPIECVAGETELEDGTCLPAGVQPDGCPAGEHLGEDGECLPAGIPPELCVPGFEPDGNGSCDPILPAEPCLPGQLAQLGETECHEVAPCGTGTWGDIPVDSTTEYVDGSYTGGASDGSAASPWTTIQQGIDAANPGAIVAVAAGSYGEDVIILGKAVRLWGRCPAMVEVVGTDTPGAVSFGVGSDGGEVRDLAVVGGSFGVTAYGVTGVVVDRLWIHDTAQSGLFVQQLVGEPGLTISRSLLERNTAAAIYDEGSHLAVTTSVVRNVQLEPQTQTRGVGIEALANSEPVGAAGLSVEFSIIEGAYAYGVSIRGVDASFEGVLVRGTQIAPGYIYEATGLDASPSPLSGERSRVVMRSSVLDRNRRCGATLFSTDAEFDGVAIADNLLDDDSELLGQGLAIWMSAQSDTGSDVTLRNSVVERASSFGVWISGSRAVLEATVVRDLEPHPVTETFGRGIGAKTFELTGNPAELVVRGSVVERAASTGVALWGATATLESAVDHTHEAAVGVFGSELTLEGTVVHQTSASLDETLFGDAVVALNKTNGVAVATVTGSRLSSAARAGLVLFGSEVQLGTTAFECNPIHINTERYGGGEPTLVDLGGNACGCDGEVVDCKALSTQLEPPEPPAAP
ncbi:MAG: hypothetical protein JRI68_29840 [Deltaproteobacteria bacterium]|nr:hypothetical protein [Deltaproteobacteria bacterium]